MDDALIGRVEFANPYHDDRGRFAPKGTGSRVPTKGIDGNSGGDGVPDKTSIKTAPAKTDLPDRGVLSEPAMDADTIARFEQAATEHAVKHAARNEKKGKWGISAVVGFGVSRHEVDKIREAYATDTPTQESFEFNETMRNWPSEYVTTYRGVKGEADPAFWQSRIGQTLEWNAPTPTSLDPVRGAGGPSSSIGDVSTDLDDPRSVGLVFEVKGYGRVLGGPPVSVAADHQVVMPPGRYTIESVAHARIPLSGRSDRQKPVLVVTIRNDRDVSSQAGWEHGSPRAEEPPASGPSGFDDLLPGLRDPGYNPLHGRTTLDPRTWFTVSEETIADDPDWDRYVGEPDEIIWADDVPGADLTLIGRVQFTAPPPPAQPAPEIQVGRVQFTAPPPPAQPAPEIQVGRVQFANPYHDHLGRFARKDQGRRVPTKGVQEPTGADWNGTADQVRAAINAHVAENPLSTTDGEARYDQVSEIMSKIGLQSALNTNAIHNTLGPSRAEWAPDRARKQIAVVDDVMDEVRAAGLPRDRECLVLGGLPGSGKSSSLRPGEAAEELGVQSWEPGKEMRPGTTHVSINADIMKELIIANGMLPGGIDGLKPMEQANFIHKESSRMAKMLMARLQDEGYNVTIDGTLDDDSRDKIEPLIERGYTFKGMFADVPLQESIDSAKARYIRDAFTEEGGRFVPSQVQLRGVAATDGRMSPNRNVFDRLAGVRADGSVTGDGLFDLFLVIDNTGISNGAPRKDVTVRGTGSGRNPWK